MNAASTSQGNNRSNPQSNSSNDNGGLHHLSPREAALKGASMAFSKQQQQQQQKQQQQQNTGTTQPKGLAPSPNFPAPTPQRDNSARTAAASATKTRSPAGSVSSRTGNKATRQAAGNGSGGLSRQTTGSSVDSERDRERLALFLSSPGSPYVLSPPGGNGNNNNNRGASNASFIAATLAASRSVSPSPAGQGGGENGNHGMKRTPLGEPAIIRRGGSMRTASPEAAPSTTSLEDITDTKSLVPMTSLISMFETRRDIDMDPVKSSPDSRIKKKAKPPKPKPKALRAVGDDGHPVATSSQDGHGQSSKQRPPALPARKSSASVTIRSKAPKSTASPERSPLRSREINTQSRPHVASTGTDGQGSTKPTSPDEATEDARPVSAGSMSSNDSFVSASSTPTRAESPPIFDPASRSLVSRTGNLHRASSLKPTPSMPILRRTATGSSQLTVDSLSSAIVAGSLASARHTPAPISGARTPPPIPPSRRQVGKSNTVSRKSSPHRMRQTLRQARAISDDEEARRPHHKKKLINKKKHTHHEGSRRRWRNEVTEREKKRYEAVWASNRGLFLVQSAQSCSDSADPDHPPTHHHHGPGQIVRTESYEALSEHVPSVVVRDIWGRSRLPAAELAEVWDLVYGRTGRVHAALNRVEFVVGLWLIDQRLRGRKIPTTVSDSVWDSAKGLRVWSPPEQAHGHVVKGKGKGK